MQFRFAVTHQNQRFSASWKLWSHGDDVYLLQRGIMANKNKFSFHKSGNCRWALIDRQRSGSERVLSEFQRGDIPKKGSGERCELLQLNFPTNHLSERDGPENFSKVALINSAPANQAIGLSLFLSEDDFEATHHLCHHRQWGTLVCTGQLKSGHFVHMAGGSFDCGEVKIAIPDEPDLVGKVFGEMNFPNEDVSNSGRPIRLGLLNSNIQPWSFWELGGLPFVRGKICISLVGAPNMSTANSRVLI